MRISTVVFDFDGTLVDSNAIKRQGFFDVVADEPFNTPRMQAVLATGQGDRYTIFESYVAARDASGIKGPDADSLVRRYSDLVDARVAEAPEMPGASEILRELRQAGLRVFISSATPMANLTCIIERRRWRDWCNGLYGYPYRKSDTLKTISAMPGINSRSIAVIGDGADDLDSARVMGCIFFPVGEARGVLAGTQVFTLQEVAERLLRSCNSLRQSIPHC
jgi:phosphoglycolate phosphatase